MHKVEVLSGYCILS
jgi:hypothetical protein